MIARMTQYFIYFLNKLNFDISTLNDAKRLDICNKKKRCLKYCCSFKVTKSPTLRIYLKYFKLENQTTFPYGA